MFFFLKLSYRTSLFSHRKASIFIRWNGRNNKLPGKDLSSIIASKSATQQTPINRELLSSYSSRHESFSSPVGRSPLLNSFTPVLGPTQIGVRDRYEEKRSMALITKFVYVDNKPAKGLQGHQKHFGVIGYGTWDIETKEAGFVQEKVKDGIFILTSEQKGVNQDGVFVPTKKISSTNLDGDPTDQYMVTKLRSPHQNDWYYLASAPDFQVQNIAEHETRDLFEQEQLSDATHRVCSRLGLTPKNKI